jgi:hypothetical protein
MKRSNPKRYAKPRFGRKVSTIGARHTGEDMRLERARLIGLISQRAGSSSAQMRIWARRLVQGKRV